MDESMRTENGRWRATIREQRKERQKDKGSSNEQKTTKTASRITNKPQS